MTTVPLAEWRPDVPLVNSQHTGNVLNVLPIDGGYAPFPAFAAYSDALAAAPFGAFYAKDTSGTVHIFAGAAAALYKLSSTSWTDVTRTVGGAYSANVDAQWSFAQFGNFVIAVNVNDAPQVYELGVSTNFAALGGSPPQSNYVQVWGDYVVLMNQTSDATKLTWCDTNDITNWSTGVSDSQVFPDGGAIQGATSATNPIVFMERAIYRGTFVPGSTIAFTFTKVEDGRGAKSPYSICQRGPYAFFADEGGFYQISPDGSVAPIGREKVDRTVFGSLDAGSIATIQGEVDPFFSRVYFMCDFGGTGTPDTMIIYDWELQRWTQVSKSLSYVFPAATPGYTLDGLSPTYTDLDALPFSLDSKVWQGGGVVMGGLDSDMKLGFFSGDPMAATVETQEAGDVTGSITCIKSIYPVVDTNTYTVRVASRAKRSDAVTYGASYSPSSVTGRVDKLFAARFHRIRVSIPAATMWNTFQAVDADVMPAGRR